MKFSNQVDLVQLEQFGVNQKADILESQINQPEIDLPKELKQIQYQIEEAKRKNDKRNSKEYTSELNSLVSLPNNKEILRLH
jgi:hypothetical protein